MDVRHEQLTRPSRRRRVETQPATEGPKGSQSVDRALTILALFGEDRTEVGLTEVAAALDVHRSTASRLLAALARRGFVEQDPSSGRFHPGLGLISLAGLALLRFPARTLARRVLFELRDGTGETTQLGVLDGDEVLYIEQASSPHVSVNVDWVGYRQTALESVSGRLLLAFQSAETLERLRLTSSSDEARRGSALTSEEVTAIRDRGYLVGTADDESWRDGTSGVAVPIRDNAGQVVYALAVGGPPHRVTVERLATELAPAALRAAARVSEALGYLLW